MTSLIPFSRMKSNSDFKTQIKEEFKVKDTGDASLLLGMKVEQSADNISLSQESFIDTLVEKYKINSTSDMKHSETPLQPGIKLCCATPEEQQKFQSLNENYRRLIGSLNYLSSATRPDITFAVHTLSQFGAKPGITHWDSGLQVLSYLKRTKGYRLSYNKNTATNLVAYADRLG